jgi:hypothetical protein
MAPRSVVAPLRSDSVALGRGAHNDVVEESRVHVVAAEFKHSHGRLDPRMR